MRNVGWAEDAARALLLCAQIEAEQHGPGAELASEFKPTPPDLADALIYTSASVAGGGTSGCRERYSLMSCSRRMSACPQC